MSELVGREAANESVAKRFSRMMNATTSPIGVVVDPPVVALVTGVLLIAFLAALRSDASFTLVEVLGVLAAIPVALAVVGTLLLLGARSRVVAWLASLPFPVENVNAVLNGVGEGLEITFEGDLPDVPELNVELDKVSPDAFVTDKLEDEKVTVVRIGVVDSKRNPAKTNYARWKRLLALVNDVLVPLHAKNAITVVRVR